MWFRPQAADTITSWLRPSMSLGASTLLVSPCPSCPFSFRPADQEQDEVGGREGGQGSLTGQVGTLSNADKSGSPRRCPLKQENKVKALAFQAMTGLLRPASLGRVTGIRYMTLSPEMSVSTGSQPPAAYVNFSDPLFWVTGWDPP